VQQAVDSGTLQLVPDGDGRSGWTVVINGVANSHLDLDDPTRLDFEYMRWIGDLLDVMAAPDEPLRVAHLGGAGCTLPRYLAATRPDSTQIVFEVDAGVVQATREAFGLRSSRRLRIRVGDGRDGLTGLAEDSLDVVLRDAFVGAAVPGHLCTTEFLTEVRRVLVPDGIYLANLADTPPLTLARAEAATALGCFRHVALIAEPAQFKGRRNGNVVLAASAAELPVGPLTRRLASGAVRARLLVGPEVRGFCGGARALTDPEPWHRPGAGPARTRHTLEPHEDAPRS
jgi:spermidine synthase